MGTVVVGQVARDLVLVVDEVPEPGDALVAALTTALYRGLSPGVAGRWAVAASGLAVQRVGGRPQLTAETLQARLASVPAARLVSSP